MSARPSSRRWLFAVWALGAMGTALPTADALTPPVDRLTAGPVDGTALGDIDADGRLEMAVLTRASSTRLSTISVRSSNGAPRWLAESSVALAGFPTMADFDGDARDEVVYCELHHAGSCHLRDDNGVLRWSAGPFYFPGMSTSGPAAVDVDRDGRYEVVIASYGGAVVLLDGRTGAERWRYDAWEQRGELFFGHPAVGDLTGDGDYEIVLVGYVNGDVIALDAATGAEAWVYPDYYWNFGGFSYANGALVADIDGATGQEVVISYSGATQVLALRGNGQVLWNVPVANARFEFMTPVAGDVDGNGRRELFVQDGTGVLRQLSPAGAVTRQRALGGYSWVPPSFADTNGDGVVELIASTERTVFLLDAALGVRDSYTYPGGGLMPTPVVGDMDRNGRVDFYTGSWWNVRLLRFELGSPSQHRWDTLAGGSGHGGAHAIYATGSTAEVSVDGIGQMIGGAVTAPGVTPADQTALANASAATDQSMTALLEGSTAGAIDAIDDALVALQGVSGVDTEEYEQQLVASALEIAQDQLDRVVAMGGSSQAVASARLQLTLAQISASFGLSRIAVALAEGAANSLSGASYRSDSCSGSTPTDLYMVWLCELQGVRADVEAVASGDASLGAAVTDLEDAITAIARVDTFAAVASVRDAVDAMDASSIDVSGSLLDAADLAMRMTRHYLDDATLAGATAAAALAAAESEFAAGEAAFDAGELTSAVAHFEAATGLAAP